MIWRPQSGCSAGVDPLGGGLELRRRRAGTAGDPAGQRRSRPLRGVRGCRSELQELIDLVGRRRVDLQLTRKRDDPLVPCHHRQIRVICVDPATGSLKIITHDGQQDTVAVEEPLEIRVDGEPVAVTMRTPGHDEELALGFLYGEGLIDQPHAAGLTEDLANNTIEVAGPLLRELATRRFYTTSSCGVCGKGAIEEVSVDSRPLPAWTAAPLPRELLAALPDKLVQPGFARTGGLHATGLLDSSGDLICVREDVGRHNAMDKVVGWALREGLTPLHSLLLCVSGRLSFELVQKAAVAGAPVLVGVGAPTSLAVALAQDRNLTLCGFARGGRVNVYSGEQRVGV